VWGAPFSCLDPPHPFAAFAVYYHATLLPVLDLRVCSQTFSPSLALFTPHSPPLLITHSLCSKGKGQATLHASYMLLRALEGWNRITPWLPLFPRGKACRAASCSVCNLPPWDVLGFGLLLSFLELSAIGIPHSPAIE
jgi:hypothetical protein